MDTESNLDPGRWARSCSLFERAVELADPDRVRFLEGECADDPAMFRLLLRMLDADRATLNEIDRLDAGLDPVRSRGFEFLLERFRPPGPRGE